MAKYKPAGSRKAAKRAVNPGAVPCLIIIFGALMLVGVVLYFALQQGK